MNNKGFTLVELLAVIVILGLVVGISISSYTGYIDKTKKNNEIVFKDNLGNFIDTFITKNTTKFTDSSSIGNGIYKENYNNQAITFNTLIDNNIMTEIDLKNKSNDDTSCSANTNITIYRDENYVYCYTVKLDCLKYLEDDETTLSNCSSYMLSKLEGN